MIANESFAAVNRADARSQGVEDGNIHIVSATAKTAAIEIAAHPHTRSLLQHKLKVNHAASVDVLM